MNDSTTSPPLPDQHPPAKSGKYLTKQQLAARLGVSVRTIDGLMRQRKIPYIKLTARLVRFPADEVEAYLAEYLRIDPRWD